MAADRASQDIIEGLNRLSLEVNASQRTMQKRLRDVSESQFGTCLDEHGWRITALYYSCYTKMEIIQGF